MAKAKITIPRELLEQLAPPEPFWDDEYGYGCQHCVHLAVGRPLRLPRERHEPGCPWVQARQLLEG